MATLLHSIYGRLLGMSSTYGLLIGSKGSTIFDSIAVTRDSTGALTSPHDEPVVTSTSTGGATLTGSGVTVLNTTAAAPAFLLAAPVAGRLAEIYIVSSASTITFGGTSTSQVFMKVAGTAAGSTILTLTDVSLAGQCLKLRGLSATQWGVLHGSTAIQT